MTRERTAPSPRMTEHHKARIRLPLLTLLTFLVPLVAGVRSITIWLLYVVFAVLYSLWALRLTSTFSGDRRLGYLLCLTDAALLMPLLVWSTGPGPRILIVLCYGMGLLTTYTLDRRGAWREGSETGTRRASGTRASGRGVVTDPRMVLEHAVRTRLGLFAESGTRFALVILNVLRYQEACAYYGQEAADRMMAAVARRGLRHLGPDAQRFPLGHGRLGFLFEIEPLPPGSPHAKGDWSEPYDVEGMAMRLARRTCEHLIEGHRVECVVGWASVPADGLTADDLLFTAENATRSTEAFRRVSGVRVTARVKPTSGPATRRIASAVAVPDEARTAVG